MSAEIHGRILGGTIGAVLTLSCRSQKTSQSKYILFVQPDNRKSYLARIDSGNHTILSDWRVSSSILPGNQYNRLELNCAKNGITARVNGALVAMSQDDSYREGGIEFGAGLMSETRVPIEARFDNLMIIQR